MLTSINNKPANPNFTAIKIADTRNVLHNISTEIQLLELSPKYDKHFLKTFDVNMETLMPGLAKYNYERWHEMLEYAKDNALKNDRRTLLAVTQGKPCGIMAFQPGKKNFHLDCICTWPIEYAQKVNYAGTTLFNQLFKIFNAEKANKIRLEAITDGPYDTVTKYKKLGFVPIGANGHKVEMETNTQRVKQQLDILENYINYKDVKNSEQQPITKFIDY